MSVICTPIANIGDHDVLLVLDKLIHLEEPIGMLPDYIRAHKHSSSNRKEILESETCGCFFCCQIYSPSEIQDWVDEHNGIGTTALCPKCGIDSVIGAVSGFPVTEDFLATMHNYWFSDV